MDSSFPQIICDNNNNNNNNRLINTNNNSVNYVSGIKLVKRSADLGLAVDLQNVVFGYKKNVLILKNISLEIPKGKIYGLLGSSGSGKTTLLRIVLGRLKPINGSIRVFGVKPGSVQSHIPGPGVGYMPQEIALFKEFTIGEILCYFGLLYHINMKTIKGRINHLTELLNLPKKTRKIGSLSGGQQRLVSIAVAMFHKPPLLILDEPTVGVDSLLRCRIWEYLENMCKNEGTTVVITTHYIEEANSASTVAYIENGTLLTQSDPNELLVNHKCQTLEEVFLHLSIEKRKTLEKSGIQESVNLSREENYLKTNLSNERQKSIDFDRLKALLWKIYVRSTRNPMILIIFLMLPVVQITLFCVCTSGTPKNIEVAIHEPDINNHLSHIFLKNIDGNVLRESYHKTKEKAIDSVLKGKAFIAITFAKQFSDSFNIRVHDPYDLTDEELDESQIKLYADMTNSAVGPFIYHSLLNSSQNFLQSYTSLLGYNPLSFSIPFKIEEPVYGTRDSTVFEFTAPGVIVATIHVTTMLFSALLIVVEKKNGYLERDIVAGVHPIEVLLSHIISLFVAVFVKVVLLMIFSFVVFNIPMRGSVLDAFALIQLQGLQGMSFGLLISVITSDEALALIIVFSIVFPMWFFSAVFWPIEAIPKHLHMFTYSAPLTLPIEALRSVLLRSWNIMHTQVLLGYSISIFYILMFLLFAMLIFKKS